MGRGAPSKSPKRWPPPPPGRRQRRRTRRQRKDRRSTAPTAWERSSRMGPREWTEQSEGQVQAWHVVNARIFSRSTIGLLRYSQRAATPPGRQTCEQELRIRSLNEALSWRANGGKRSARRTRWPCSSWPLSSASGLGRCGPVRHVLHWAQWAPRGGGRKRQSRGLRFLESARRETKLRDRLTVLDAVVVRRVLCAGVPCSVDRLGGERKRSGEEAWTSLDRKPASHGGFGSGERGGLFWGVQTAPYLPGGILSHTGRENWVITWDSPYGRVALCPKGNVPSDPIRR